jgi:malonyl-CoA/methylmalonyl-CoA synthetase
MLLTDALRKSLASESHRIAVRTESSEVSRGELLARAEERAGCLSAPGRGDPFLALEAEDAARFLVELLGARLAERTVLVHAPGIPDRLKRLREDVARRVSPAPRTIFYSSGSLGAGKPVPISDSQMLFAALAYSEEAIGPADRVALGVSPGHVFGFVRGVLNSLLVGAEVIPFTPTRDPVGDAEMAGGSVALLSTRHIRLAARAPRSSALRVILTGGAPLPESAARFVEERRGTPIRHGYGLTETAGLATRQSPGVPRRAGTSGRPAAGMRVDVVREDGSPAPAGADGEIRIAGPAVFDGYADAHLPFSFDGEGRFCTGDLGHFDEAGELVVRGRAKLTVWRKGRLLCAEELETAALEEDSVSDAAAVPFGEALGLLLVASGGSPADRRRALDDMHSRLPAFGKPSRVRFVDEIPRRASGKVDRFAVSRLLEGP